jgi:hypothetical protein
MITIFGDFRPFLGENIGVFLKKPDVMIQVMEKLAVF